MAATRLPVSLIARTAGSALAALSTLEAARAADMPLAPDVPVFEKLDGKLWIVTLTGNLQATPRSPGSDEYTALGYPGVGIREAGTPQRFSTPDDGVSFSVYDSERFRLGPTARYVPGRYFADDRRHLFGLRDAAFAVEPGVFVEYYPVAWLRARGELRHGIFGHHGFVGSVGLDLIQPLDRFQFSIGPRFNFGDEAFARRYFGVTPIEALANDRISAFTPGSYATVGGLTALTYTFSEQWATTGYVGYNRIVGSTADSPLVRRGFGSPNQYVFGAKVDYSFTMPALF
ncbi:MipA/OmpV family protein [Methylobacterium planeticum]|uniref:MipA/OmpV family protein n=1 Tax=Methylobacterium planeticum TaxID=2615211 RepID=A0A6N6MX72_9HYPH|nr:MipA/OmpV family protein [Methylobacterium planeticum]KAB1076301.1 MipA/OmpV family protein [Methylobacterium planeticum]